MMRMWLGRLVVRVLGPGADAPHPSSRAEDGVSMSLRTCAAFAREHRWRIAALAVVAAVIIVGKQYYRDASPAELATPKRTEFGPEAKSKRPVL